MMQTNWLSSCRRSLAVFSSVALLSIAGCGGGGGSAAAPAPAGQAPSGQAPVQDNGELLFAITDAEGDFVSYLVDVVAIELKRTNGDIVNVLPTRTRIDFTQLAELTELLSVASVPVGNYDKVSLRLDYTNAEVMVQNAAGEPVTANLRDVNGNAVTILDVELELTGNDIIRITPRSLRAMSLDFDLDASNTVDLSTNPPTVRVEPVLLATSELEANREHRVRGLLDTVVEADGKVTLKVRPFRHRTGSFGSTTFTMTSDADYEIDGDSLEGSAGLAALAGKPKDTPVVAHAFVRDGALRADRLLAGTSVPWANVEVAHGVVTARGSDRLTLSGVAISTRDGRFEFSRTITVLVGDDTAVNAPGLDSDDLDQLSVSVGQRVAVSGNLTTDNNLDATLDATSGRMQMQMNRVAGQVVSGSPLVVDLEFLNGRRPAAFNFTGTGITTADDANPDRYEIRTDSGIADDLTAGDFIQVHGLVSRFGFAPPDFLARSVTEVDTDNRGAGVKIGWQDGSATPFLSSSPTRLELDLTAARAELELGGRGRDRESDLEELALIAPADGRGVYAVIKRGDDKATLFRDFGAMVEAVVGQLNTGAKLHRITAQGRYTADEAELTTARASFVFKSTGTGSGG